MRLFVRNILLAAIWCLIWGSVSFVNLLIGFVLGYLILRYVRRDHPDTHYFRKVQHILVFPFWFGWELLLSNVRVAREVLRIHPTSLPGTVAIPLEVSTDIEITMLANLITLTPGTLSLAVSDDRTTLYIHAMFIEHPDQVRIEIKEGLEKQVLELFR